MAVKEEQWPSSKYSPSQLRSPGFDELMDLDEADRTMKADMDIDCDMPNQDSSTASLHSTTNFASEDVLAEFPSTKHTEPVIGESKYTWTIDDWSLACEAKGNRFYSESFITNTRDSSGQEGAWWFKLLLMPKGQDRSDRAISLYLALDEEMNAAKLSRNEWSLCAQFIFTIVNPESGKRRSKYIYHRFDADAVDWGFSQFLMKNPSDPENISHYVHSNRTIINAQVRIIDDTNGMLWVSPASVAYDSKRATGCVGLQNQGATCYMNSILQSLFLTNAFRKSVFSIPTDGKDQRDSIPLALQRLFYALTFSSQPPGTNDLTASFGWDLHESFTQHDVQEFLRVLMDDLEEKFKGTGADGTIDKMFGGRVKKVIRCSDIPFESSRSETVYDVQMPVAGCPTLKDSFDSYITRETMTGDNKYMAEGHGLQDAVMFNVFDLLPPVLHLILMRYRYDPLRDATVKINDRFEFPEEINLDAYMSDAAESDISQEYLLHSVLVHSGDGHGGHYTAFIRPDPVNKKSFWLKFDDTRVTVVSKEEAVDDNFGGNNHGSPEDDPGSILTRSRSALAPKLGSREAKQAYYKRVTNAYMLVYIRRCDALSVLCSFTLADVPSHIIRQIEEDHRLEEAKYQERLLQKTTVKLSVYTPKSIHDHPGYDLFCSEPHPACPITPAHSFRLNRDWNLSTVIDALQSTEPEFANGGRLWTLAHRRNRTLRIDSVVYDSKISEPDDVVSLGLLADRTPAPLLELFAEPIAPELETGCSTNQRTTISIFFKLFDPVLNKLTPLHGLLVDRMQNIIKYEPFIRKMLPMSAPLEYYEEVKVCRVDKLHHLERTFAECELQNGDVIVIVPQIQSAPYSLTNYYDDFMSMLQVNFVNLQTREPKKMEDFEAVISAKASMSDLTKLIGGKTNWDPAKIRPIPQADSSFSAPRTSGSKIVEYEDMNKQWTQCLLGNQTVSPALAVTVFYELLPIPFSELFGKKHVHIRDREGGELSLWVDKEKPVSSLKLDGHDILKSSGSGMVHVYEMAGCKIVKELSPDKPFSEAPDDLFVERFPNPKPNELYIPGYLHHRDISWGLPFVFKLIVGEPLSETRKRLALYLQIGSEREAAKLGIGLARYGRIQQKGELTESSILLPEMRDLQPHEQLAVEQVERPKTPSDFAIKIKRAAPMNE